jgi:hypothetical protein
MSFFPDLGTETPIDEGAHIRAIGWLHPDHPFDEGECPADAAQRIREFCERADDAAAALEWPFTAGVHTCELCGDVAAGGNLAVPDGDVLYVAPELLHHYVAAHRYLPPECFLRVISAAPLPGTGAYEAAVMRFRRI